MSSHAPTDPFADLADLPPSERGRIVLFRLLVVTGNELRSRMDQVLAPSGVTTQQAALLTIVLGALAPPSLGEAAARLGCTHQNVKQIATALQRKGLLAIEADPADGRVRRLVAGAASRAPFAARDTADRGTVAGWFSALSDAEVAAMIDALWRLRRAT